MLHSEEGHVTEALQRPRLAAQPVVLVCIQNKACIFSINGKPQERDLDAEHSKLNHIGISGH